MRLKSSISVKLLVFILPLVCLPIGILGFFSIKAAEQRVNRLVRHEQMIKVEGAADRIEDILNKCRIDLQTLSGLPVLEDFYIAKTFRLAAETEFHRENIRRLFREFIMRCPYYYRIRLLGMAGEEFIGASALQHASVSADVNASVFKNARLAGRGEIHYSDIVYSSAKGGHLMLWVMPFYSSWHEFSGFVVIELDYEGILRLVNRIRVGQDGYAFMVDSQDRVIAHPGYAPYQMARDQFPESSLRDLIEDMNRGGSSWKSYRFEGSLKVAAYAPIGTMGWSLAVTIPVAELGREAAAVKMRVIEVAAAVLVFGVLGVGLLSYYLLRPVRELAAATNRIAAGDLTHKISIQSRDELGDLTRSFNHMVENLARSQRELIRSEKLVSMGRLSAGVAHEIRNPLNAMKGAIVHIQRRRKDDPLIAEYTQLVSEEIDRLSQLATEFLIFAKQSRPKIEATDINQLILDVESLFKKQARGGGIILNHRLDPNLPLIAVDPNQMEQVLVNLMINAMDALPHGGKVTFSTSYRHSSGNGGDSIRIEAVDNGIGISEQHIQAVFDPFFSTKETGTGLGLPISLGIVESHNGSMVLSSSEAEGVRIIIDLPV